MFTNIPKNNKETNKQESILFNRDMLYIDDRIKNLLTQTRYEKYPLISINYKITPNIIYKDYEFLLLKKFSLF